MPANLPPMYFEAEKRFRDGKTPEEKIEALEEMLAIMPKHKGTDHLKADLRARISPSKKKVPKKKLPYGSIPTPSKEKTARRLPSLVPPTVENHPCSIV